MPRVPPQYAALLSVLAKRRAAHGDTQMEVSICFLQNEVK